MNENAKALIENVRNKYRTLTEYLISHNLIVSTMESCTSGLIASLITDAEGSSAIFKGGYITYSNEAKILQGVDENIIKKYGVYSEETALQMADKCRKLYSADIGIGVTGTFGNADKDNADSVPGKVYIAIYINDKSKATCISLCDTSDRFINKFQVADEVFNVLFSLL